MEPAGIPEPAFPGTGGTAVTPRDRQALLIGRAVQQAIAAGHRITGAAPQPDGAITLTIETEVTLRRSERPSSLEPLVVGATFVDPAGVRCRVAGWRIAHGSEDMIIDYHGVDDRCHTGSLPESEVRRLRAYPGAHLKGAPG